MMNELNRRFKQYRISTNTTQEELSEKSGVSVYTIKKFENGSDIRISTLNKLLNSLGLINVFDNLIVDVSDRPSYRAKQKKEKMRARTIKNNDNSKWKWGN